MIYFLPFIAVLLCIPFAVAYVTHTRPARKQARAAAGVVAIPAPEPRVPRDLDRPYPRPKGKHSAATRERLRTCPVCGMTDLGQMIPDDLADLFGWPVHASCKEWLGDWKPPGLDCDGCGVPLGTGVRYYDKAGHHYCPACDRKGYGHQKPASAQAGGASAVFFAGKGAVTAAGGGGSSTSNAVNGMLANGHMTINEARERLDREIIASWGVPPAVLQEHTRKVGDPLPVERCPKCGAQFVGPPGYLREAYKMHLQVGCRTQGFEIG